MVVVVVVAWLAVVVSTSMCITVPTHVFTASAVIIPATVALIQP